MSRGACIIYRQYLWWTALTKQRPTYGITFQKRLIQGFPIFWITEMSELEADVLFSPTETSSSSASESCFLELSLIKKLQTGLQCTSLKRSILILGLITVSIVAVKWFAKKKVAVSSSVQLSFWRQTPEVYVAMILLVVATISGSQIVYLIFAIFDKFCNLRPGNLT